MGWRKKTGFMELVDIRLNQPYLILCICGLSLWDIRSLLSLSWRPEFSSGTRFVGLKYKALIAVCQRSYVGLRSSIDYNFVFMNLRVAFSGNTSELVTDYMHIIITIIGVIYILFSSLSLYKYLHSIEYLKLLLWLVIFFHTLGRKTTWTLSCHRRNSV